MKVAVVHDWLVTRAGAERVLEQILRLYPEADLFAPVDFLPEAERGWLPGRVPRTTLVQHLPFARRRYRGYLPVMAWAVGRFDLSGYDLVISSSHAVAKGVRTAPGQLHVSYVYSPMRYAWDLREQYLRETGLDRGIRGVLARALLERMRRWDLGTAARVDAMACLSDYVAERIRKAYGRDARVIYPPVDLDFFTAGEASGGAREDFYLTVSRFVPYKKIDAIVAAFAALPDRRLVVIGDGPQRAGIERLAGPNVTLLGRRSDEEVREHMRRARAFLFAAEEDFGIVPLEAQACGTPVIAYGRGGALETIRGPGAAVPTGLFFAEQSPQAVAAAIAEFERDPGRFSPEACRRNAEAFSAARFRTEFAGFVDSALSAHRVGRASGMRADASPRDEAAPRVLNRPLSGAR
ncbi:MAG TPA: glycosyltransferase [Kiloniellales bacterium]|nr:glycosyltransferase [Kiloniellales bacterium]